MPPSFISQLMASKANHYRNGSTQRPNTRLGTEQINEKMRIDITNTLRDGSASKNSKHTHTSLYSPFLIRDTNLPLQASATMSVNDDSDDTHTQTPSLLSDTGIWNQQEKVQTFLQQFEIGKESKERLSIAATASDTSAEDHEETVNKNDEELTHSVPLVREKHSLASLFQNRAQGLNKATSTVERVNVGQKPPSDVDKSTMNKDLEVPLKQNEKYQQYFKMLKVGLPRPMVEHKMRSDGMDCSVLDCDPELPLPERYQDKGTKEEIAMEEAYQKELKLYTECVPKFHRMLKVGLPRAAVEHKMQAEGCDPSWLDGPPKKKAVTAPGDCTEEEIAAHRKQYEKFFAMLQYGIAREAVELKMTQLGIDPAVLNGPVRTSNTKEELASSAKKAGDALIRKKLHWETLCHAARTPESTLHSEASIWHRAIETGIRQSLRLSQRNQEELEQYFVKKASDSSRKRPLQNQKGSSSISSAGAKEQSKNSGTSQKIALIDLKKSQNIAIILARVKMPFSDLRREILAMNPTVLSTSQIKTLMEMWPDRTEQQAIKNYKGSVDVLGTTERFLVEVREEPRFCERLGCLVFKQEFSSRVFELRESIHLINRVVHQICSSQALLHMFVYILEVGNYLNFGANATPSSTADGFSLRSLSRLSQTKAFVGNISVLQYIIRSVEREAPDLKHFYEEIKLVAKCSRISLSAILLEKKSLDEGLQKLNHESSALNPNTYSLDEELAAPILKQFSVEVTQELQAIDLLLVQMDESKRRFLEYFEEEKSSDELDVLICYLASFIEEYKLEEKRYAEEKKRKEQAKARERRSLSRPRSSVSIRTIHMEKERMAECQRPQTSALCRSENGIETEALTVKVVGVQTLNEAHPSRKTAISIELAKEIVSHHQKKRMSVSCA